MNQIQPFHPGPLALSPFAGHAQEAPPLGLDHFHAVPSPVSHRQQGHTQGFPLQHPGHYQRPLDGASQAIHHSPAPDGRLQTQFPAAPGQHQQPHPYTTARSPVHAAQVSAPAPQSSVRHSASPQQPFSPYASQHQPQHQPSQAQQQQQQPQQRQTPPQRYPMAAPPLPQTPANQQQHQSAGSAAGSPGTPQSPGSQSLEQRRVALLLEINLELLQEINKLQAQGRGGATTTMQIQQLKAMGQPAAMASDDYIQCLRRVQANLSYLAPVHAGGKKPPGPAHMTPPSHMPQLQPMYDQLREVFPGWAGFDHRLSASAASPSNTTPTNGMNAPGSNVTTPAQS